MSSKITQFVQIKVTDPNEPAAKPKSILVPVHAKKELDEKVKATIQGAIENIAAEELASLSEINVIENEIQCVGKEKITTLTVGKEVGEKKVSNIACRFLSEAIPTPTITSKEFKKINWGEVISLIFSTIFTLGYALYSFIEEKKEAYYQKHWLRSLALLSAKKPSFDEYATTLESADRILEKKQLRTKDKHASDAIQITRDRLKKGIQLGRNFHLAAKGSISRSEAERELQEAITKAFAFDPPQEVMIATGSEEEQFVPQLMSLKKEGENVIIKIDTSLADGTLRTTTLTVKYESEEALTKLLSEAIFIASLGAGSLPEDISTAQQEAEKLFKIAPAKKEERAVAKHTRLEGVLKEKAEAITIEENTALQSFATDTTETKRSKLAAISHLAGLNDYDIEVEALHLSLKSLLKIRSDMLQKSPHNYFTLVKLFREQAAALHEKIAAEKGLSVALDQTRLFFDFIDQEEAAFQELRIQSPVLHKATSAPFTTTFDIAVQAAPPAISAAKKGKVAPFQPSNAVQTSLTNLQPCATPDEVLTHFEKQLGAIEILSNEVNDLLENGEKSLALEVATRALRKLPAPELIEKALAEGTITLEQIQRYQECIQKLSHYTWEAHLLLQESQPSPSTMIALAKAELIIMAILREKALQLPSLRLTGSRNALLQMDPDALISLPNLSAKDKMTILLGLCPKESLILTKLFEMDLCLRSFNAEERAQLAGLREYAKKQRNLASTMTGQVQQAWEKLTFVGTNINNNDGTPSPFEAIFITNMLTPPWSLNTEEHPDYADWIALRRQSLYMQSIYSPEAYLYQAFESNLEAISEVESIHKKASQGRTREETIEAGKQLQYQNIKSRLATCKRLTLEETREGPRFLKSNNRIKDRDSNKPVADIYSKGFPDPRFRNTPKELPMQGAIGSLPEGMLKSGEYISTTESAFATIPILQGSPSLERCIQIQDQRSTKQDPLTELSLYQVQVEEQRSYTSAGQNRTREENSFLSSIQAIRIAHDRPHTLKDPIVARRVIQAALSSNSLSAAMLESPEAMRDLYLLLKKDLLSKDITSESKAVLQLLVHLIEQEASFWETTFSKIDPNTIDSWGHFSKMLPSSGFVRNFWEASNHKNQKEAYFTVRNHVGSNFKDILQNAQESPIATISCNPQEESDIASATALLIYLSKENPTEKDLAIAAQHYALLKQAGRISTLPDLTKEVIARFEFEALPRITSRSEEAQKKFSESLFDLFKIKGKQVPSTFLETLKMVTSKEGRGAKNPLPISLRISPLYTSIFGSLSPEAISQELPDGKLTYEFEHQGRKFSLLFDPDKNELTASMTIGKKTYEHRKTQGISKKASEQAFLKKLDTLGVWIEKDHPTSGIAFLNSFDQLQEQADPLANTLKLNWPKSGSRNPEITFGPKNLHVASSTTRDQRVLEQLATNGNLLFLTDSKGNLEEIKILSPDWTLICNENGDLEAPFLGEGYKLNLQTNAIQGALGKDASQIGMTFEKGKEKIFVVWPRKTPNNVVGYATSSTPLTPENTPLMFRLSEKGELTGNGPGFLYLAYLNMKEKNFALAAEMLAKLSSASCQFDPSDQVLFEAVAETIFSMQPTTYLECAFFLKAAVQIEQIRRERFGQFTTSFNSKTLREEAEILRAKTLFETLDKADPKPNLKDFGLALTSSEVSTLKTLESTSPYSKFFDKIPERKETLPSKPGRLSKHPDALILALLAANPTPSKPMPLDALLLQLRNHPKAIFDHYFDLVDAAVTYDADSPEHAALEVFCQTMLALPKRGLPLETELEQALLSIQELLLVKKEEARLAKAPPPPPAEVAEKGKEVKPPPTLAESLSTLEDLKMQEGSPLSLTKADLFIKSVKASYEQKRFAVVTSQERAQQKRNTLDMFFKELRSQSAKITTPEQPASTYTKEEILACCKEDMKTIVEAIAKEDGSPKSLETWTTQILLRQQQSSSTLLEERSTKEIEAIQAHKTTPTAAQTALPARVYISQAHKANAGEIKTLTAVFTDETRTVNYGGFQTAFAPSNDMPAVQQQEMARIQAGFGKCQIERQKETPYTIGKKELAQVEKTLHAKSESLASSTEDLSVKLVNFAKKHSKALGLDQLMLLPNAKEKILLRLLDLYESGDLGKLLPENECKALEADITEYLFQKAELQALDRILGSDGVLEACKKASTKEDILDCATKLRNSIDEAFDRSRHLNPDGTFKNEKNHRAFLRFEAEKGFILREEQFTTINKILSSPNALEELRMGLGKSAVIFPMCAKLLTSKDEQCVVIYTEELLRQSAKELDPRAYRFEFDRNVNLSLSSLNSMYHTLLQAKSEGKYIITTLSRIAALQNKMVELLEDLSVLREKIAKLDEQITTPSPKALELEQKIEDVQTKIKQIQQPSGFAYVSSLVQSVWYGQEQYIQSQTGLVKELQQEGVGLAKQLEEEKSKLLPLVEQKAKLEAQATHLKAQHTKLSQIHGALTEKTRFLIDEVDEVEDVNSDQNYSLGTAEKLNGTSIEACERVFNTPSLQTALQSKALTSLTPKEQDALRETIAKEVITELRKNPLFQDLPENAYTWLTNADTDIDASCAANGITLSKDVKEQLGALRHFIAYTLPGVFKKEMGKDYGFTKDHMLVAPRKAERTKPNTSYGEEYEFLAFHYATYSQEVPSQDLFENCIEDPSFKSLYEKLAKELPAGKEVTPAALYNVIKDKKNAHFRREFLTLLLTHTTYVTRYNKQIKRNVQQVLGGNAAGASGTFNRYAMPIIFDKKSRMEPPPRVTTADLILRLTGGKAENLQKEITTFDNPLEQLEIYAKDPNCKAIINPSLSLEASPKDLIAKLRKKPHGAKRDWIYLDGTTRLTMIWRTGEEAPRIFDKKTDMALIDPKKVLYYFAPADIIGTDFKIPSGYGALLVGPTTQLTQFEQAAWRLRQLGNGQTIQLCAPKTVFPDKAKPTIQDAIVRVTSRLCDEIKNQNVKALGMRPVCAVAFALQPLLFSPSPSSLKNELYSLTKHLFIEEKVVNYLRELAKTQPEEVEKYFRRVVKKQKDDLDEIQKELEAKAAGSQDPHDIAFMKAFQKQVDAAKEQLDELAAEFAPNSASLKEHLKNLPKTVDKNIFEEGSETTVEQTAETQQQIAQETTALTEAQTELKQPAVAPSKTVIEGDIAYDHSKTRIPATSSLFEALNLVEGQNIPGFGAIPELEGLYFGSGFFELWRNINPHNLLNAYFTATIPDIFGAVEEFNPEIRVIINSTNSLPQLSRSVNNNELPDYPGDRRFTSIALKQRPYDKTIVEYSLPEKNAPSTLVGGTRVASILDSLMEDAQKYHAIASKDPLTNKEIGESRYFLQQVQLNFGMHFPVNHFVTMWDDAKIKQVTISTCDALLSLKNQKAKCEQLQCAAKILLGYDTFSEEEKPALDGFLQSLSPQSKIEFKTLLEKKNMCPNVRKQLGTLIEAERKK